MVRNKLPQCTGMVKENQIAALSDILKSTITEISWKITLANLTSPTNFRNGLQGTEINAEQNMQCLHTITVQDINIVSCFKDFLKKFCRGKEMVK